MRGMESEPKPFVAPCRDLSLRDPVRWLRAGWQDFRAAPSLSLAWGVFCWFLSTVVTFAAWRTGGWALLISLLSGFIFVAPLLAFGMYNVSRQLCLGNRPTLVDPALLRPGRFDRQITVDRPDLPGPGPWSTYFFPRTAA